METYYWESKTGYGQYKAKSDEKAKRKMPEDCIILYKESDTKDGQPFIIIWENES